MATNFLDRYVWLIETIRNAGHITFKELNRKWRECSLNETREPLAERTFFNHRQAIYKEIGVEIVYEKPLGYCITNKDDIGNSGLRNWMLTSIAVNSVMKEAAGLRSRILIEDIPSGIFFLTPIIEAMKERVMVEFEYNPYRYSAEEGRNHEGKKQVAPYCLKLFHQRWYLLGKVDGEGQSKGEFRIYALDRMANLNPTSKRFKLSERFKAEEFFSEYFGVVLEDGVKPDIIRLKVWDKQRNYFRSLPLHQSQKETEIHPEWSVFEYYMAPTWDLSMELMKYGDTVEVLSPESLKNDIIDRAYCILNNYEEL